tara:strand:- start:408 stop:647 length:240 start_codon:yes stop_codon:yes gene_type:complete
MSEVFQLPKKYWAKYGSNWLKFERDVLLYAPAMTDGSTDHLLDDEEWSEVSDLAFDNERDREKFYMLAVGTQTKGETNG